jgi:hypothetical protein
MAVIELLTFRLAAGAATDELLSVDRRVQLELMLHHTGLLRRTTARNAEGDWVVMTLWESPEYADASALVARGHEDLVAFESLTDQGTARLERYETLD